jgi:hypothetical protein
MHPTNTILFGMSDNFTCQEDSNNHILTMQCFSSTLLLLIQSGYKSIFLRRRGGRERLPGSNKCHWPEEHGYLLSVKTQ